MQNWAQYRHTSKQSFVVSKSDSWMQYQYHMSMLQLSALLLSLSSRHQLLVLDLLEISTIKKQENTNSKYLIYS